MSNTSEDELVILGYARVSTVDQSTDIQVSRLKAAGATEIFVEKTSGGSNRRSATFRDLFDRIRELKTEGRRVKVIVTKLDRWGRSLSDVIASLLELALLEVQFHSLDDGLQYDRSNPYSKLQVHMLAMFAELEKDLINARTSEGRTVARAKGVKFGHPPKLKQKDVEKIRDDHESGRWTPAQIANRNSTSRSTVLRVLGLYGAGPYQTREEWEAEKRAAQRKK